MFRLEKVAIEKCTILTGNNLQTNLEGVIWKIRKINFEHLNGKPIVIGMQTGDDDNKPTVVDIHMR